MGCRWTPVLGRQSGHSLVPPTELWGLCLRAFHYIKRSYRLICLYTKCFGRPKVGFSLNKQFAKSWNLPPSYQSKVHALPHKPWSDQGLHDLSKRHLRDSPIRYHTVYAARECLLPCGSYCTHHVGSRCICECAKLLSNQIRLHGHSGFFSCRFLDHLV